MMSFTKYLIMLVLLTGAVVASEAKHMATMSGETHAPDHAGGATAKWSRADDIAFLSGMIAHHQGALKMAEKVVDSARDKSVRRWARDIIAAQREEITRMQSMLDEMGGTDKAAAEAMTHMMDAMAAAKKSDDADMNFVAQMIPHHAGAVEMSLPALTGSGDPEIRELAETIIVDQTREIAMFRNWMDEKKGKE